MAKEKQRKGWGCSGEVPWDTLPPMVARASFLFRKLWDCYGPPGSGSGFPFYILPKSFGGFEGSECFLEIPPMHRINSG